MRIRRGMGVGHRRLRGQVQHIASAHIPLAVTLSSGFNHLHWKLKNVG